MRFIILVRRWKKKERKSIEKEKLKAKSSSQYIFITINIIR